MKRLLAIVASAAILTQMTARAEPPKPTLTVQEAMAAAIALRNLDGRMVVTKTNGVENTVMIPWEFNSGALRLKIAADLAILAAVERTAEEARRKLVAEGLKKFPDQTSIPPASPEFAEFSKEYAALLAQPATGVADLQRIRASELKLDKNEIAPTVLQALAPILDPAN